MPSGSLHGERHEADVEHDDIHQPVEVDVEVLHEDGHGHCVSGCARLARAVRRDLGPFAQRCG